MKIVVLKGSPRLKGTSSAIADSLIKGLKVNNHEIITYDVAHLDIHPCMGCDHCAMSGPCVFKDDMVNILNDILSSDMLVFVTPIYYFGFSAQIKALIDRFYSQNGQIQRKHLKAIFIASAWNDDDVVMSAIKKHIDILVDYLNLDLKGEILATGYGYRGAYKEDEYLKEAYELGKEIL